MLDINEKLEMLKNGTLTVLKAMHTPTKKDTNLKVITRTIKTNTQADEFPELSDTEKEPLKAVRKLENDKSPVGEEDLDRINDLHDYAAKYNDPNMAFLIHKIYGLMSIELDHRRRIDQLTTKLIKLELDNHLSSYRVSLRG